MNEKISTLLQLYENTLASQGIHRREEPHSAQSGDLRLSHARWMIDNMQQNSTKDKWADREVNRQLGIIQGILWSEMVFSMPAIVDQNRDLYQETAKVS